MGTEASDLEKVIEAKMMGLMRELSSLAPKTYKLEQRKVISAGFNAIAANESFMALSLQEQPHKLGLEKWLSYYQRKLYSLRKQSLGAAPQMAA